LNCATRALFAPSMKRARLINLATRLAPGPSCQRPSWHGRFITFVSCKDQHMNGRKNICMLGVSRSLRDPRRNQTCHACKPLRQKEKLEVLQPPPDAARPLLKSRRAGTPDAQAAKPCFGERRVASAADKTVYHRQMDYVSRFDPAMARGTSPTSSRSGAWP
jgi:hypothetical protein